MHFNFKYILIFIIALLFINCKYSFAQQDDKKKKDKVLLRKAKLIRKDKEQPNVRKLIEGVIVEQKGTVLKCDSAYLYEDKNAVDAFGNARLTGSDGVRLKSRDMYYDGENEVASAVGDVVLIDEDMRLTTEELDYNVAAGTAFYTTGGKIVDSEKTLESQVGTYDTNSKVFYFQKDVKLVMKKKGQTIVTDSLTYNTISKIAYFQGPTTITSKDGVVYTEDGFINTETEESNFRGRSNVDTPEYYLEGDSLYFDNAQGIGYAEGDVLLIAKEDSVWINGDIGKINRQKGNNVVYGNAVMRNVSEKDTLYLSADTLRSINNKETEEKYMLAYPKPRIYRTEFQGKCDSLVYNRGDSTIYFYGDPVLWNNKSQITADSIWLNLINNKPHRMYMRVNSYMISKDTLENFNQLKGVHMTAFFKKNQISKLEVRGNGQNIYFALEGDTLMKGMNRAECSDIDVRFGDENKLSRISYISDVDAVFVPPHELQDPQKRFKNFKWRIEEKPTKKEMLLLIGENLTLDDKKVKKRIKD